jgi:UrcA family protein
MYKKVGLFKAPLLLAAVGVTMVSVSGVATAAESTAAQLSEIVVQSPRITPEYSPWSRTWEERYSATVRVGYSDLDLTDGTAVQTLHARVKTAAQLACQKLNHLVLVSDQQCLEGTLAAAQPRVQAAVNAAVQAALLAKQEQARS